MKLLLHKPSITKVKPQKSQRHLFSLYQQLYAEHGDPKLLWPQWCASEKDEEMRQLISIGAFLVQRTSWHNAEIALRNLRERKLTTFELIAALPSYEDLIELIRVAGFFTTKPRRLYEFCRYVVNTYGSLEEMRKRPFIELRSELLGLYGIGPETADTLLLYALDIPTFIIDEYTKRFVQKYAVTNDIHYDVLKAFFEKSLPKDIDIYQCYHILMIADQKGREHCIMNGV